MLLNSLDLDEPLIIKTKLPLWLDWITPEYKFYNTRWPDSPFGNTIMLVIITFSILLWSSCRACRLLNSDKRIVLKQNLLEEEGNNR